MLRTGSLRTLLLFAVACARGLAACSSPEGLHPGPDQVSTSDALLQGNATAAQLGIFRQRTARDWAWAGGQFDAPADDGAELVAETPLTFAWHADPADFAQGGAPGDAVMTHLLSFSTSGNERLLEVFSTLPEYAPDAKGWQKLVDVAEPITVSLTTGTFVGGDLPEEGGPFIGQALTFTIE